MDCQEELFTTIFSMQVISGELDLYFPSVSKLQTHRSWRCMAGRVKWRQEGRDQVSAGAFLFLELLLADLGSFLGNSELDSRQCS